jgi:ParB-like chromosome segregation protein Spo0J
MARLSKLEIYSILWLDYINKSIPDISKELKVDETKIKNVLEKNKKINDPKDTKIKSGSESMGRIQAKDLMIRETIAKKTNNVSIMTQQASAAFEEMQKLSTSTTKNRNDSNIFRPNK